MLIIVTAKFQSNTFFPPPTFLQISHLFELAVDDSNNQQNQHRDNRNRYNPICSHPETITD